MRFENAITCSSDKPEPQSSDQIGGEYIKNKICLASICQLHQLYKEYYRKKNYINSMIQLS